MLPLPRRLFRRCVCCAEHASATAALPLSRRRFVAGGAAALAVGAGAAPGATIPPARAQAPDKPQRIDVHHHFSPPKWIAEVKGRELLQPANTNWTPDKSIEDMDKGGVAAAVVSVTNPGLWFGDPAMTRRLARDCNDYGAKLVQDHPKRFGLFAATPMPDIDATLREIEYAYDQLKADGIHFFTSYGDVWFGNPRFTPVMEELNRRKAVIHIHPTAPNCCKNLIPDVPAGVMEYGTDTTRAILGVMFSGTAVRFPDIRYIWSHGGGTAPFLAGRIEGSATRLKDREQRLPNGAMHELRKFYYDTAGAANPATNATAAAPAKKRSFIFSLSSDPENVTGRRPAP